jgi:hypothetical protein
MPQLEKAIASALVERGKYNNNNKNNNSSRASKIQDSARVTAGIDNGWRE